MEAVTLVAASWAGGINAYLTVLVLSVGGNLGWVEAPDLLTSPSVMVASAVMSAIEFVADKVPYLDNAWDAVHTVVRPTIAAVLSTAIAGAEIGDWQAALLGGGIALTGHTAKSSLRLVINTSPEPVSNIVTSVAEDGLVIALVGLAMADPQLAAVIAVVLMILSFVVAFSLWKLARRGWRAVRRRLEQRRTGRA